MGIYNSLYSIINEYIFAGSIVAESVQDLACTLIALVGSISLIALPFIFVFRILRLF